MPDRHLAVDPVAGKVQISLFDVRVEIPKDERPSLTISVEVAAGDEVEGSDRLIAVAGEQAAALTSRLTIRCLM